MQTSDYNAADTEHGDSNLKKVGPILKPVKYNTLSLSIGTTTNHQFQLGENELQTIVSTSFKFLDETFPTT